MSAPVTPVQGEGSSIRATEAGASTGTPMPASTPSTPSSTPAPGSAQPAEPGSVMKDEPAQAKKPDTAEPLLPGKNENGSSVKLSVNVQQEIKQCLVDADALRRLLMFPGSPALEISRMTEMDSASRFIYDEAFVNSAEAAVRQHRVLILTGEEGTGKQSMACYLAGRLREDGLIERDTRVYEPQGKDVKLNLRDALVQEETLHGRVVIFQDALKRRNQGMCDFLALLKGEAVASVTRDLERIQSYVIMTAAPATLPPECAATLPAALRAPVPPLAPERLLKGVRNHISYFLQRTPDVELAKTVLPGGLIEAIAVRSGTMSLAIRFIDLHLIQVLRSEKTLERAFEELNSLHPWCQQIAESNTEAWIYCLALVLADSLDEKEGVPWADFVVMYDAVRRHLLRRRRPFPEKPVDEDGLQALLGVEVKRDPALIRDLVMFKDSNTGERLWNVLLKKFRSLLTDLLPVLLELTGSASPYVRSMAAQALGRIGGLDAAAMARPWLERWAKSTDWKERTLVGYAAQGVLSAGDPEYRNYLLALLDHYSQNKRQTWAAVSAYRQIGSMDFALGMDKLKAIAKDRLAPAFEASREIEQRLEKLDRALAGSKALDADVIRLILLSLGKFYESLFADDEELARTFQYSLVSLSMSPGLIPVLTHLTRWALDGPAMGALVCMMFLQQEGIADELTERNLTLVLSPVNGSERKQISCNMVLAALVNDPEAIGVMAKFLQAMYAALLEFFPPDTAVLATHLLFDTFKKWVVAALPEPRCREAMVELVSRLLHSRLRELYERTFDWLASDPDFLKPEMAAFAKSARRFQLPAKT